MIRGQPILHINEHPIEPRLGHLLDGEEVGHAHDSAEGSRALAQEGAKPATMSLRNPLSSRRLRPGIDAMSC